MKYWMKNHNKGFLGLLLICSILSVSFKSTEKEPSRFVEINTIYGKIIIGLYNETPLHRDNFMKRAQEKGFDSLLFHRVIPQLMIQGGDPRSKYAKSGEQLGMSDSGKGVPMELKKELFHKRGALAMARDRRNAYESSPNQFYIVQGRTFTAEELNEVENNNNIIGKQEVLKAVMKSDSVTAKIEDFKIRGDKDGLHTYMVNLQDGLDKMYEPLAFSFSPAQIYSYMGAGGAPHLDGMYTVFGEVVYGMNVVDSIANAPRDAYDRPLTDIRMTVKVVNLKSAPAKKK
jgi:cyclophilin family peptidyl-prolyl cis-trans isomerase